ncbi:exodeoxyribonuclease VII small subunit [Acidaminobacter sp. JC074]|uniref:exodeoxyribonuclease VII small subunit n=1 Tax=Acidaminobacter sp. JC074 TaxID=2530199 RepID=UPI001F103632|nr:exodeoxyribonuclease VII small subunit [Acidaminobacter sp. JC074]MCH4888823.1 exodeoxyribonuclease VII small subunit [Acidaminobacter sp. JC074]
MNKFKDFEKDLKKLDEIVASLEAGELSLSEALSAFEKGIGLYNACHQVLEGAEDQVKILIDNMETGEKEAVSFNDFGE